MPRAIKDINLEIGQRIKERRKELRLNREELARLTGYSNNFIQEVERGRSGLSSESLRAFSIALNVSVDHIVFGPASRSFDSVAHKLETVPEEKLSHVLKIIDEAINCAK